GDERLLRATPHDLARQTPGAPFVAEVLEDRSELALVERIEEIRRGRSLALHSHVQWRAFTEGEAARLCVDLPRRNAEVEEDAVEVLLPCIDVREVGVIAEHRAKASLAFEALQPCSCGRDGLGVTIDACHVLGTGLE